MSENRLQWQAFRRTRWGPARVVAQRNTIEATVGEAVVELDLTDRRPAAERQAEPWRSLYDFGVPVRLGGEQVATVTTASNRSGLIRRAHLEVTGDSPFVLPGLEFTHRGLPHLLTLRCDAGTLVSSRRWASPVNMAVTEWSIVREYDLVPPRVARDAEAGHIAFWMAVKESQRT